MTSQASGSPTRRPTSGLSVIRYGVGLLVALSLALAFAAPASAKSTKPKKPGAPTGLTAFGVEGGATFSWSAPASDGGSPITGYVVTVQKEGCSTTGATTCTVTSLTDGHAYTARVRAVNAIGQGKTSSSRPIRPRTVPTSSPTPISGTAHWAVRTLTASTWPEPISLAPNSTTPPSTAPTSTTRFSVLVRRRSSPRPPSTVRR